MSLLETSIAIFLLVTAFVVVLSLFIRSSEYQVNVGRKVLAVTFGEVMLDDLKAWAGDYANYSGSWDEWSLKTMAEYPGYSAKFTIGKPEVAVPSTQLEEIRPPAKRFLMRETFRDVDLTVDFEGAPQLSLTTRITEPARKVSELKLVLESGSSSLGRNDDAKFRARLLDYSNQEIQDVVFRWSVLSMGGNATAVGNYPESWNGTLTHRFVGADGILRFIPGRCQARAVATYRGVEYSGLSQVVELLP